MTLRIGIDVRDLKIAKAGTGTYLKEICIAFKKLETDKIKFIFFDSYIPVYTGKNNSFKFLEHIRFQLWKQVVLPLKAWASKCDILFCTDYFVPLVRLGYKTIPVFHDAFFFEYPEHYNRMWLWLFKNTALPAARNSPFIIVPTNHAKSKIIKHFKFEEDKIKIVGEGPKSLKTSNIANSTVILNKYGLQNQTYLLHVGTFDKRKNIAPLIRAFGKIKIQGLNHKLVLVGKVYPKKYSNDYNEILYEISKHSHPEDIILTGYLEDEQLGILYQNALMYVFPSLNEGFGIPVLEAFSHKVPVLVSNNTCLPEVGGDAVVTFDPFNEDDIKEKIIQVAENEKIRNQLINKGSQRLMNFSWKKAATELLLIFQDASGKHILKDSTND